MWISHGQILNLIFSCYLVQLETWKSWNTIKIGLIPSLGSMHTPAGLRARSPVGGKCGHSGDRWGGSDQPKIKGSVLFWLWSEEDYLKDEMWGMREVGKLGKHPEIQGTSGEAHWGQKCYWSQRSSGILTSLLSICFQVNSFVNGQGPDPEWGCLVPAAVCRFVTLCKEDLTTQIHLTMRIDWLIDWFKIYLLIMLLQLSTFFLCPLHPVPPFPLAIPSLFHIHGSCIEVFWLLHFLYCS